MFSDSKYTRWYFGIIAAAKQQCRAKSTDSYLESHHIVPRCLGGTNEQDNLVLLTYREHFVCHHLLTKMVDDKDTKRKLTHAFIRMNNKSKLLSHQYEKVRQTARQLKLGSKASPEALDKMKKHAKERFAFGGNFKGKRHSDQSRQLQSLAKKGKNHPFWGSKRPEHGVKVSTALKGRTKSDEHKKSLSASWQKSRTRIICVHCGIETTKAMHTRWHGHNCKQIMR